MRYWSYWKYRINALLLLLPVVFVYQSTQPQTLQHWLATTEQLKLSIAATHPYHYRQQTYCDFSIDTKQGSIQSIQVAYLYFSDQPIKNEKAYSVEHILSRKNQQLSGHIALPDTQNTAHYLRLSLTTTDGQQYHFSWPWEIN